MTAGKLGKMIGGAARTLRLNSLRTLLSTLGIIFAVMALVAMLAIGEGAKSETLEQIRQLGTNAVLVRSLGAGREAFLDRVDLDRLEHGIPGLERIAGLREVSVPIAGYPAGDDTAEVLAVTGGFADLKGLTVAEGRPLSELDVSRRERVCVLGVEVSERLGPKGQVGQALHLGEVPFRIVGILAPRQWTAGDTPALTDRNANRAVLIPQGTELDLAAGGGDAFHEIVFQMSREDQVTPAAATARQVLIRARHGQEDFQLVVPIELMRQAQQTQRVFNIVLACIAGISLLVGGIGIMNMMLVSVTERTSEIGVRRAFGARRQDIAVQFLLESILVTGAGGTLGLAMGSLAASVIGGLAGWRTDVTVWAMMLALAMSAGVGLVSGLYPAVKASRLSPVEALRHR